jgi:hypothetical protein
MILALALTLAAATLPQPSLQPPLVVIRGNVALVEDVYRAALDLSDTARADATTARSIAVKLRKFLHRSGYSLATVEAFVSGHQIFVNIDEGRLDKVIFLGGGAFETLRLRLDLHIHDDVFNRPELERQLRSFAQRMGLADFAYEIVPVGNAPLPKLQLDDIEPLEELSLGVLRPGRPYELHILVKPGTFSPGLEPEVEVDSIEGGGFGATYHGGGLLGADDRFNVGIRAAGALRSRLDGSSSSVTFTRGIVGASYETTPIAGVLRPSLHLGVDLSHRQRGDLNLESFQFTVLDAGIQALFQPNRYLKASLGTGVARRLLYGVQEGANLPQLVPPDSLAQTRQYAEASIELTLDPENLRRDQHHTFYLGARVYGRPHVDEQGELFLLGSYQRVIPIGWNDLVIDGRAVLRNGFVIYPEEEPVGDSLHGVFSNEYARKLAVANVEFRYSLLRDVFKIGLFHNLAVYGEINRTNDSEKTILADAFGLAFHALMIDDFQLDAYFGGGFAGGGKTDRGAALSIKQAY